MIMSNSFYSAPSAMSGGFTVYGGYRRQRGGGIFGSFRKMMAPVGKQAWSAMKKVASNKTVQSIARKAAEKGAEVVAGVAVDALQGRNIGESIKERARDAALQSLGVPPSNAVPQKRFKQKKRLAPAKNIFEPPAKKQRRTISQAALNRKNLF